MNRNSKPTSHIAAVLVLLFESEGHLRVLLTTRAKRLVHGGETCLPGGHMEDADGRDIEYTAVRSEPFFYLDTFAKERHKINLLPATCSAAQRSA